MLEVKLGQKRGTINRKKCNFQILEKLSTWTSSLHDMA